MVEDQGETAGEPVRTGIPEDYAAKARAEAEAQGGAHRFIEVWNDYDPSMRFIVIFPVGVEHGVTASSVAYYVFEPGRHSGLHHDNAEEIAFVAEGEGEVFTLGTTTKLVAGTFVVFPAGADHDIYAQGGVPLRLLSFFPTAEILSTFQQPVYPVGGNVLELGAAAADRHRARSRQPPGRFSVQPRRARPCWRDRASRADDDRAAHRDGCAWRNAFCRA